MLLLIMLFNETLPFRTTLKYFQKKYDSDICFKITRGERWGQMKEDCF